jgi:hypothetical protein
MDENFFKKPDELEQQESKKRDLETYNTFYRRGKGRGYKDFNERSLHNSISRLLNLNFSKQFYETTPEVRGDDSQLANLGMICALQKNNPLLMLDSAKLYESMSMGSRSSVQKRLKQFVKKNYRTLSPEYINEVEEFLRKNSKPKINLEKSII